MIKKIAFAVIAVLVTASTSRAESVFDVLSSAVKAAASGAQKTVSNADPAKVVSNTVDATGETAQAAGEATLGGAANTVGVVSKATGNK
jgi:Skp family chaperone for outer membrane proteins